jgi:hypothetical protein
MSVQIKKFAILGERCSGTNFLEESILSNFNITHTIEHGSKHFFCFNKYDKVKTADTLFIGIIRNPIYWLNSFSKELYHVPEINRKSLKAFFFNEFYSVADEISASNNDNVFLMNSNPYTYKYNTIPEDLNYVTGKKYKNIFEMRKFKNHYLINIMPTQVKNFILINYEDLLYNYDQTLSDLKLKFNLIQTNKKFEIVTRYKKSETYKFVRQRLISFPENIIKIIWRNLDEKQEASLGYFIGDNNAYFTTKCSLNKAVPKAVSCNEPTSQTM